MVSDEGLVKIIDFGFGKRIDFNQDYGKSISLNWAFTAPDEFLSKTYDFKTEIFFVGKLFEFIVVENKLEEFAHKDVLRSMTSSYGDRIDTFFDISRRITEGGYDFNRFSDQERLVYRKFADELKWGLNKIDIAAIYFSDIDKIVRSLDELYQSSILEDDVQNVSDLADCFVNGGYSCHIDRRMAVETLKHFVAWMKVASPEKRRIILTHLWKRLDTIPRDYRDVLPF